MATIQALTFVPTQISGCQFWIDAADASTVTLSGNQVTNVRDKSGNGYNLSNGSGFTYNQVKFNTNYPSFYNSATPGTTDKIGSNASFSISQPMTAFVVGQMATTGNNFIFDGNTSRIGIYAQTYNFFAGSQINGSTNVLLSPYIISALGNTTSSSGFLNGSLFISGNIGTNALTSLVVGNATGGSGSPLTGHLCELLFYSGNVSIGQRQEVEGYLAWKWGLQNSLPTTHPYYYAPPNSAGLGYPSALKVRVPTQSFSSGPVIGFDPTSLPGCRIWLDGADPSTVILSAGSVSQWRDKSGFSNNFGVQSGAPNYASNGVGFVGSNSDLLQTANTFTFATNTSIFFYVAQTTYIASTLMDMIAFGTTNSLRYSNGILNGTQAATGDGNDFANANYTVNGTFNPNFGSNIYTAKHLVTAPNQTLSGTRIITLSDTFMSRYYTGRIYELLFYNSGLTTVQRQQVEGYLAWKWGLQTSLPGTHPYRLVSPGFNFQVVLPITRFFQQSSFSPARISGCLMWLDANDINGTGVNPPLGSTFTSWTDKSGSGNTVIAGVASTTTNYSGRNAVFLNGNSFTRSATFAVANTTIFLVFAVSTGQNDRPFMTIGAGANSGSGDCTVLYCDANVTKPGGSPSGRIYYGSGGGTQLTISYGTASAADVIPYCIQSITVSSSPVVTNFLNGFTNATKTGTVPRISVNNATIGGSLVWYLSEFILYNSVLSDSTRQSVEGYLAWKWNLQGSLPSTSPFKKLPPLPN